MNDDSRGLRCPHDEDGGRVGDAAEERGLSEYSLSGRDVGACARGRGEAETRREGEAQEADRPGHAKYPTILNPNCSHSGLYWV